MALTLLGMPFRMNKVKLVDALKLKLKYGIFLECLDEKTGPTSWAKMIM